MMKIPMFKKFRQIAHEKSGMTLVELIVAFALIGIFMIAATFMLGTSFQLFGRMQSSSQAVTVSDLILDKIVGEIAAADLPKKGDAGYYFWLESEKKSPWLAFCNRSGSPVAIYADDDGDRSNGSGKGSLFIKYYGMGEGEEKKISEMDWRFDRRVYMGYQITSLNFSREATEHPNVVRIDLTLEHEQSGATYSTFRYAENYNFDVNSDYMCTRNDGNTGMPVQAKEFEIEAEPAPEPEPNETKYIVEHHVGGRVITEEFFAENGSTFFTYPKTAVDPRFEGYQAVEARHQVVIEKDVVNTYVFNYKEIEAEMVKYMVEHYLGRDVILREVFYGKVGSTVVIYARDSSSPGFERLRVRDGFESATFILESALERTYIFDYEVIPEEKAEYTILHRRQSDGYIFMKENGTAPVGTQITAKAKDSSDPLLKGYVATESSKTLMITSSVDKNICEFYYVPTNMGEREYLIKCEAPYLWYGISDPLGFTSSSGQHAENKKLYEEKRFHTSAGGEFEPPPIQGYTPTKPTYKVTPYLSTIVVPYTPNTVKLRIYAKHGDQILAETVLDVKYNSVVYLNNEKLTIGRYKSVIDKPLVKPHAQLKIDQLTNMEYTFYYN